LANLDANLRLEMRKLIRTLQQDLQMTTLLVTHDQEEAIMLADQVALMQEGRLLQNGSPQALYEQPRTPAVARFFRNENLLPGFKSGAQVTLELGETGQCAVAVDNPRAVEETPDGPVWLTVRPEHVRLGEAGVHNGLPVVPVGDAVYMGSYAQMQVMVGGRTWQVHLPPDASLGPSPGIYLPPDRIWLMARDEIVAVG
jgi:ABC-type Fe3+/spermidine/putrescine transport system ATPase subunit